MGKDKGTTSQPQQQPIADTKVGKGHRQRGAGTVITAKPPVVTADGVTLKAHERLPFQLVLNHNNPRFYLPYGEHYF